MKNRFQSYIILLLFIGAILTILALIFTNDAGDAKGPVVEALTPEPTATVTPKYVPPTPTMSSQQPPTPAPTVIPTSVPFSERLTKICPQDAAVNVGANIQYHESFVDRYPGESEIAFSDNLSGQHISFCLKRPGQAIISTQSTQHPDRPTMVMFKVPVGKQQPTERIWILINASYTNVNHLDKELATIRIKFQNNGSYEKIFPLNVGEELADWKIDAHTAGTFGGDQVQVLRNTDGNGGLVQLIAVPLTIDVANRDPVVAVSIEDRSSAVLKSTDPALDIIAVTLVARAPFGTLPEFYPSPNVPSVPEYLCLRSYRDSSIAAYAREQIPRQMIKQQDNVNFSFSDNNCETPTRFVQLAKPVREWLDIVIPADGAILETHPTKNDAEAVAAPASKIVIDFLEEQDARMASRIHFILSGRNLCLERGKRDWFGDQIGYINVYFEDGYALEKLPLIVGQTIRQARERSTCANDSVRDLDDSTQAQLSNMHVSKGIEVYPNAVDEQFGIWLDVVTIMVPPQLQGRPISSIEIVDDTIEGRDGTKFNDPYISLFAVTLMHNP